MTIRLFALLSIATVIFACMPNQQSLEQSIEQSIVIGINDLRTFSLNMVRVFGLETLPFLVENGEEKTIAAAQNSVRKNMTDPDSAKFQNLRIVDYDEGKVVCGEVNGENSFGGYVGYKIFVAGISGAMIYDTDDDEDQRITDAYNAGINAACKNN